MSADGSLSYDYVYYASLCARPALALKSSLLVSVSAEDGEKALCDYTDTELLDELLRRRTEKKPEPVIPHFSTPSVDALAEVFTNIGKKLTGGNNNA